MKWDMHVLDAWSLVRMAVSGRISICKYHSSIYFHSLTQPQVQELNMWGECCAMKKRWAIWLKKRCGTMIFLRRLSFISKTIIVPSLLKFNDLFYSLFNFFGKCYPFCSWAPLVFVSHFLTMDHEKEINDFIEYDW